MTNKQYLIKYLDELNVSENDIEIILLKGGLDGEATVDIYACDIAVYRRFSAVLKSAAKNVSEGGYSVSWNMEAVKLFYSSLCNELGVENVLVVRPKVGNKSDFW